MRRLIWSPIEGSSATQKCKLANIHHYDRREGDCPSSLSTQLTNCMIPFLLFVSSFSLPFQSQCRLDHLPSWMEGRFLHHSICGHSPALTHLAVRCMWFLIMENTEVLSWESKNPWFWILPLLSIYKITLGRPLLLCPSSPFWPT